MSQAANSWLVIVDPQNIFADPGSDWASPFFADAWLNTARLVEHFGQRIIITRWLPTADRDSSWGDYFRAWQFADVAPSDSKYELTTEAAKIAASLPAEQIIDAAEFGKWNDSMKQLVGHAPQLVITGVATDCCVVSTVLPAADAGAHITVVNDAVAHSTEANGAAALQIMSLYEPMVKICSTAELLAQLSDQQ